ncbi:ParB N-terminal domain-containing protein [Bacillus sp. FSL W8-0920]|uniref:ParB N-terminal domain-containing protein n=1 Tax=Bacillus sp. FSL W8-0920 TaxID=2954636 RepID=UPI003159167C
MYEQPQLKEMYITDLTLSMTNPRFPREVKSEAEAILTFFQLKKVGPGKIMSLIEDIVETGIVLENFIVLKKDGEFIVHDGNRRLTALKLLNNNTSEIIKNDYPKVYENLKIMKENFDVKKLKLNVQVYTDSKSMANHVAKLHSGEQNGKGQINWDSNEKDTFNSQHLNQPLGLGNLIYKKLEKTAEKRELYNKLQKGSFATTLNRIFGYSNIRKRIFQLDRGLKVDLTDSVHFNKICEMIEFFISKNATVADVYTAEMASNFFEEIEPISQGNPEGKETEGNPEGKETEGNPEGNPKQEEQYKLILNLITNKKIVYLYNDYNLLELIENATDSNGENLKNKVIFSTESNYIRNNIFSGDASIGDYSVQAKLNYKGESISRRIEIKVRVPNKRIETNQPKNEFFTSVASFIIGDAKLKINNTVDTLIKEIQSLENAVDYRYMIASSLRQLMELSIEEVMNSKEIKNHGNPKQNLKFLVEKLSEKSNLHEICRGENHLKYQAIKNLIGAIDTNKLYDYLNLITHDSYATVYNVLVEKVNLEIMPILAVFHNYLHMDLHIR